MPPFPNQISVFQEVPTELTISYQADIYIKTEFGRPTRPAKTRINFRSNLDVDILDNLKMSVGVGAIINNINYSRTESETIAGSLKIAAPNFPIRWNEYPNYYAFGGEGTTNPMALADTDAAGYRHIRNKDFNIDFALEYKIPFIEGLSLKANIGYSVTDGWQKTWTKNIVYMGYRENSDEYYEASREATPTKPVFYCTMVTFGVL